jgi:phosphoenolpyruvate carboxylase
MPSSIRYLRQFEAQVVQKYQTYNGLFLSLPFEGIGDTGVKLPSFSTTCAKALQDGKSPVDIVRQHYPDISDDEIYDELFRFLQLIERQVVLFDALEDSAFDQVHDMNGSGTLPHLHRKLKTKELAKRYDEALSKNKVRIVLTAHPTQFYPRSVLSILTELSDAIKDNNLENVHQLLMQMGRTRFKNTEKPSPLDEAKSLMWHLINVLYPTIATIQKEAEEGASLKIDPTQGREPLVELGFWPGGDRDGNPFVTSETTLKVANMLQNRLMILYRDDLLKLRKRLTFEGVMESLKDIEHRIQSNILYLSLYKVSDSGQKRIGESRYESAEQFLGDLFSLRSFLIEKHQSLFLDQLDELILKVQVFGFHFASIDLRQDSRVLHQATCDALQAWSLGANGDECQSKAKAYESMSADEQKSFLQEFLKKPRSLVGIDVLEGLSKDTLLTIKAAQTIQAQNGEKGLQRFIISNTQGALNLWELITLCHIAGWSFDDLNLDIVPLFETIDDLQASGDIMHELYGNPIYKSHLEKRGKKQTVMLGFSDGTKDGGYIAANWSIYNCKEMLSDVSSQYGVSVVFFDGRGGPPARGGGNTHKFYRSMGKEVHQDEIQLTIQGQTITSNFGTKTSAKYNLQQLLTATMEASIMTPDQATFQEGERELIEELASKGLESYQNFKDHEKFVPYLEEVTPLKFYSELNFASRPTKRNGDKKLNFSDLRAIPFVGSWTQTKQNIPGFYGFGEALEALCQEGKTQALKDMHKNNLFFRTLVQNAMMSLKKSNPLLTNHLKQDPEFGDFLKVIEHESKRAKAELLKIADQSNLMEKDPINVESIVMRESLILPLTVVQQFALTILRLDKDKLSDESTEALRNLVTKTMATCINASRNSA